MVDFFELSKIYLTSHNLRTFKAHFGVSPTTAFALWSFVYSCANIKPVHLLYALHFLKTYQTSDTAANIFHVVPDTYCKHVKIMIYNLYENLVVFLYLYFSSLGNTEKIIGLAKLPAYLT